MLICKFVSLYLQCDTISKAQEYKIHFLLGSLSSYLVNIVITTVNVFTTLKSISTFLTPTILEINHSSSFCSHSLVNNVYLTFYLIFHSPCHSLSSNIHDFPSN